MEAAAAALRSFIQFKDGAALSPLKSATNMDFTSDEHLENGITQQQDADLFTSIRLSLESVNFDNKLNNNSDKIAWVSRFESKYFFC